MVMDLEKEMDINDALFGLWDRGMEQGEHAMLALLIKLGQIKEPIAGLIMDAIRHDLIRIETKKDEMKEFMNERQAEITILYKEMFGIE